LLAPTLNRSDLAVGETRDSKGNEFSVRRRGSLKGFLKQGATRYSHGHILSPFCRVPSLERKEPDEAATAVPIDQQISRDPKKPGTKIG
jgi:hypothetical protein